MKQLFLLFLLLVATIVLAAWLKGGQRELSFPGVGGANTQTMKVGEKSITVEIADSPEEHEKGLSDRDSLGRDRGLLFVMPKDTEPIFVMRRMKFPIDILWINDDKVIGTTENLLPPPDKTSEDKLIQYKAPASVDYVLEVNSGFVKENKVIPGTKVELPRNVK